MCYPIFAVGFSCRSDAETQCSEQQLKLCSHELYTMWENIVRNRSDENASMNISSVCM